MNIAERVLDVLSQDGRRTAIEEAGGRTISRRELREHILRRSQCLIDAGLAPGDRVVIQAIPGIELAVSAIAVLVAGGVMLFAEAGMAPSVYRSRVAKAAAKWFVVDRKLHLVHSMPGLDRIIWRVGIPLPPPILASQAKRLVTPLRAEANVEPAVHALPRPDHADAVIVYTGGTTQDPKGVCLSNHALHHYLSAIAYLMKSHAIERFVADTPQQILYGIYLGIDVWVTSGRGRKRALGIAKCLSAGNANMLFTHPSGWLEILHQAKRKGLPRPMDLRLVMLGGAPVSNQILKRLEAWIPQHTDVRILYGLTEVGPVCSCSSALHQYWLDEGNLVGVALPGIHLSIVKPCAKGIGELEITGPSLYSRYLGHEPSGGRLRTGDLARLVTLEGETHLVLMGRKKDMIIRRGVNIYPSAVEPIIQNIADGSGDSLLESCSLVGVWDTDKQDERVVLFYVRQPGRNFEEYRFKATLKAQISSELFPDDIISIDKIPTIGRHQKPDKRALRRLAAKTLNLEEQRSDTISSSGDN